MNPPSVRPLIHPGEILREIYLEPLGMTRHALAKSLLISHSRIDRLVAEKGKIDVRLALRPGKFFGTTPAFWLDMQTDYDLKVRLAAIKNDLADIRAFKAA
jgi:addiction module HigA family antidote